MHRRDFIKQAGFWGTAAGLSLPACSPLMTPPKSADGFKYSLGLQLFSVREPLAADPLGTLRAVKAMGYEDFEIYGYDAAENEIYGYRPREFKTVLDDLELTATTGHFGFHLFLDKPESEFLDYVDRCGEAANAMGLRYLTWPWMAPEQRTEATFRKLPALLNAIGKRAKTAGLGFAYHNHDFEFFDYEGRTGFDLILEDTDPELVKIQLDMYWVMHSSKLTPKEWIEKDPGRFVMWHIKDMDKVTRDYSELGQGSLDYVELMPDPARSGLEYYYLEQGGNFASTPLESVETSIRFFETRLRGLIER